MSKQTMKTFYIYLDKPGSGWSEVVEAKTLHQAKKIANKKHECEPPCDGGYEIQPEGVINSKIILKKLLQSSPPSESEQTNETKAIERAFCDHFEKVYAARWNSASIRVCVVDECFEGLSKDARLNMVEKYLDQLPPETQRDIVYLRVFTPKEMDSASPIETEPEFLCEYTETMLPRRSNLSDITSDLIEHLQKTSRLPPGCDLSDLGNEIVIAIAKHIDESKIGYEMASFMAGIKHGISLVDGTH